MTTCKKLQEAQQTFWKEFIEVYKQHPELWKTKSDAYKNQIKKQRAYSILLEKYREYDSEATTNCLKRKINCLRSSYRRERQKINKSLQSGCDAADVYTPNLWYFKYLDFLEDHEEPKTETMSALEMEYETSFTDSDSQYNIEDQEDPVAIFDNKETQSSVQRHSPQKRPKKLVTEKALEDLKLICNALNQPPQEQNEFDCFATSIACQLKKLPENIAQESMDFIQSYLSKQRVNCIENSCSESKWNKKRTQSEFFENWPQQEYGGKYLKNELFHIAKRVKQKQMEFMEIEHREKVQILNMEMKNLENRFQYDEKEHMLKMQQLSKQQ